MNNEICKECIILDCKKRNLNLPEVENCSKITDYSKRILYANKKGFFFSKLEDVFQDLFWFFHDINSLKLSVDLIIEAYKNPNLFFPDTSSEYVEDKMFVEIIVKFCKIAEDFGGLISSHQTNLFDWAQKYIKFTVNDALDFYDSIPLSNNNLEEIFFYPKRENQTKEKIEIINDSIEQLRIDLEFIKENYLKYRPVYNAYKHGLRANLIKANMNIEDEPSLENPDSSRLLIYYDLKSIKTNPYAVNMIKYDNFIPNLFYNIVDNCYALIEMINILLLNFHIKINGGKWSGKLYFRPSIFGILQKEENKCYSEEELDFN